MAYLGASPLGGFTSPSKDSFSGDNSTTEFTMTQSVGSPNQIDVFVDNVRQEPTTAYTVSDKTITFTGTPATGTNNIYVVHKHIGIGTGGLIPTSGRDSDRVTTMTVDGNSTVKGNLNTQGNLIGNVIHPFTLDGTDGSSTNVGDNILEETDGDMLLQETASDDLNKVGQVDSSQFQFDNNVLVKGNVEIQGNLAAPSTGDRITVESGTDASTGFLLLDSSAASTDVGEQILFEDGTSDPQNFFNTNAVFGASVKIGSATIEEDSNQLKINDQVVSFGKTALSSTLVVATDTFAGATDSVLLDFNAHNNFILTLDGSITLANPSTENVGQTGVIVAIQDGSGSRTITLGGDYESVGGAGLTLSSGANAVDIIPYIVVAANRIALGTPQLAFG